MQKEILRNQGKVTGGMFKGSNAAISPARDHACEIPCRFVVDGNFTLASRGGWVTTGECIP